MFISNPDLPPQGPHRRAPAFYAGETYGLRRIGRTGSKTRGRSINYPNVERYANGALPSKRNKLARRLIRGAFKRRFSNVERALELPRAMLEQAHEIVRSAPAVNPDTRAWVGKSPRAARRLFARELAIHEPVYVPADLRALRTAKRKLKRQGKVDAIAQLVDRMSKP